MGQVWGAGEASSEKTPNTMPGIQNMPPLSRLSRTCELSDTKSMEDMNVSGTPVYYWASGPGTTKLELLLYLYRKWKTRYNHFTELFGSTSQSLTHAFAMIQQFYSQEHTNTYSYGHLRTSAQMLTARLFTTAPNLECPSTERCTNKVCTVT